MGNVLSTPHGRQPGFKFIKDNFATIKEKFPTPLGAACGERTGIHVYSVRKNGNRKQFVATTPILLVANPFSKPLSECTIALLSALVYCLNWTVC